MANIIDQDPWIIDTPGAGDIITGKFRARTVRWVSPSAVAGHQVIIKDSSDKVKWETVASGANYVEESRVEGDWNGLRVTTLGSGKLFIEHG